MAKLKDLIAAKDELSLRLLRGRARGRAVAITAARTIKDVRKVAGRNLHAIGVGRKIVDGKRTGTLCVRLYVLEKIAKSVLPRAALLPTSIAGFPTDVIESPMALFHQPPCSKNRRRRQRPIVGGISAAHRLVNKATLGCFCRSVRPREEGRRYMLGCNHAFANLNGTLHGASIIQPSLEDGGGVSADGDRIGRLARFVPLLLGGAAPNLVDAAIAEVWPSVGVRNGICMIGPLKGITKATLGMPVRKHGRTTGYTEGEIVDPSIDPFVATYLGGAVALFVNQIRIEPTLGHGYDAPPDEVMYQGWFAAPGDSGSVVVERDSQRAVALHFAGAYGISLANPIREVCNALKIAIP